MTTKYRAPHSKPFCTSIKSNNKEAVFSHDTVIMADSCIQRIKEIADDSSYLRIMVSNSISEIRPTSTLECDKTLLFVETNVLL